MDPGKLRDNNISFHYQGNDVINTLGALLDTGADNSYIHDSVTQAIDLEHLSSLLNHTHIGFALSHLYVCSNQKHFQNTIRHAISIPSLSQVCI